MRDDEFFTALYHIKWDMEVNIFKEHDKTLALLADMAPKCSRERRRVKTMYECCAMDHIEKAVASPQDADTYLRTAAKILVNEADMRKSRAIDAVNTVASLWDNIPLLEDTGGDEEMTSENEAAENEENTDTQQNDDSGGEDEDGGGGESLLKRMVVGWCCGDYEDDRPRMHTCPIGWLMIILTGTLGVFMIMNIENGDLFSMPVFTYVFMLLATKRLYHFSSAAGLTAMYVVFYAAAVVMALYKGVQGICRWSVALAVVVFVILNSGRVSSLLDESRRKSVSAYLVITIISAAAAAGAYAVQYAL